MSALSLATHAEARSRLPVEDILSVLLPSEAQTDLLCACLHTDDRARDSWARWTAGRNATDEQLCFDLSETRTLAPLLAVSFAANGLEAGQSVRAYLRAATLREQLRADRFREIAAEVLDCLEGGGVQPVVTRGAVLAATAYETWSMRHCHDLDLLVRPESLPLALRVLGEIGCVPAGDVERMRTDALMEHPSGTRIALHTRPFALSHHESDLDWFDVARQQVIELGGVSVQATSPEVTAVHVLGHATYSPEQKNLRWVPDLWQLIDGAQLDWPVIEGMLEAHGLELPVAVLLRYLLDLGLPIPPATIARLRRSAADNAPTSEDAAVKGAVDVAGGPARLWSAIPSRRGRLRLARWAVAPSLEYVRSSAPNARRWRLPLRYLDRALRFAARSR